MRSRFVPALALVLSACLPSGRPVEGRLLFAGRAIERPGFITVNDAPAVTFEVPTSSATTLRGGSYDWWIVGYDSGDARLLMSNLSDRDTWRPQSDAAGVRYFMVDERAVEGGSAVGATSPVGTLVRFDLARGVLEQIPDVATFSVQSGLNLLVYRTLKAGSRLPELHLRQIDGADRNLGPSAGPAQVVAPGRMYFVAGEDRVLSRITSMDGPVEPIRSKVTRFLLSGDEQWVMLEAIEAGMSQTVAVNLMTGKERRLPTETSCCWQGFSDDEFTYSEPAAPPMPGRVHNYNVVTGEDRVIVLPVGLSDVASTPLHRPNSDESLLVDTRGTVARVKAGQESAGRLLDIRPTSASFTEDGNYLIYIDIDVQSPPQGRLMVQDADFLQPPRLLSPPGSLVPAGGYFFIADGPRRILVFWASYGHNPSDLYFANHETGDLRTVAERISAVTVTSRRMVGIVRLSGQDLVGDLVNKNILADTEVVLGHDVADASASGARVVFVVRGRVPSSNDGLWAIGIDGDQTGKMAGP